jgi:hypothetical protein
MADFPIAAPIECSDGPCGKSTNVIVNPVNRRVTHVVVEDKSLSLERPRPSLKAGIVGRAELLSSHGRQ